MNACQLHMCQRWLAGQNKSSFAPSPFAPHAPVQSTAEEEYYKDKDWDGEFTLCRYCNLPIGDVAYDGKGSPIHGECLAQQMLQDLKQEDQERQEREGTLKM